MTSPDWPDVRLTFPGYRASWGSTACWPDPPARFVLFTYTEPDDDGYSIRHAEFADTPLR